MKKQAIIFLALALALSFTACTAQELDTDDTDVDSTEDSTDAGDASLGGGTDDTDTGDETDDTDDTDDGSVSISTEAELFAIADDLTATYVLQNDITLTQDWVTVGGETPFTGTFDGNGHTISGMNVTSSQFAVDDTSLDYYVGMFGVLKGTVKNLTLSGFTIEITAETIAATDYAALREENTAVEDFDIHAGVVGLNKGTVQNVTVEAAIAVTPATSSARLRLGALAGKNNDTIAYCTASGTITAVNLDGYVRAGGIAGYVSSQGVVTKCSSSVGVTGTVSETGKLNLGGLIGNLECGSVTYCLATGDVIGYNTGSTDRKDAFGGGLVGILDNTGSKYDDMTATIANCYATGDVTLTEKKCYAGAFIGYIDTEAAESCLITVTDCGASGTASGNKAGSGFLGLYEIAAGDYEDVLVFSGNVCVQTDDSGYASQVESISIPDDLLS